jgi:hypothetical protein
MKKTNLLDVATVVEDLGGDPIEVLCKEARLLTLGAGLLGVRALLGVTCTDMLTDVLRVCADHRVDRDEAFRRACLLVDEERGGKKW